MKELIIIAGANGAGKTTFAFPYVEERGFAFLNADEIAKKLEMKGKSNAMIKAGRIFFERLNQFLKIGKSFVVETTLSGSYINKVAIKAKADGYQVSIIYLFVDSPDICVLRVKNRVKKGGHNVPEEDIRRRFDKSISNFWNNFTAISDDWVLIYNMEEGFQKVSSGEPNEFEVENELLFETFKNLFKT